MHRRSWIRIAWLHDNMIDDRAADLSAVLRHGEFLRISRQQYAAKQPRSRYPAHHHSDTDCLDIMNNPSYIQSINILGFICGNVRCILFCFEPFSQKLVWIQCDSSWPALHDGPVLGELWCDITRCKQICNLQFGSWRKHSNTPMKHEVGEFLWIT